MKKPDTPNNIPKIIHQLWSGEEKPLPEDLKILSETWKEYHPDWSYEFWDNNRIKSFITSNPQPIGFSGILLAKRQDSFYCTYFLHNRNVADTKSPYPIKRLEVIRWFNQKSMVFNQSLS